MSATTKQVEEAVLEQVSYDEDEMITIMANFRISDYKGSGMSAADIADDVISEFDIAVGGMAMFM